MAFALAIARAGNHKSSNIELIKECQGYFRCLLPSLNVKERCQKLSSKYENSVSTFCQYCNAL